MGEIADSMINGECCQLCGQYFVKEHGYPVVCKDDWKDLTKAEKKQYQYDWIKENVPTWEMYPAFGAGCCMPMFNTLRENIIKKIIESKKL